jgi:mono/diheme cytochrome c family protein
MRFNRALFCIAFLSSFPLFAQSDKAARGKYLVEEVARCQECHTPKLPDGQFNREKWLKGATLNVQPIDAVKGWHKTSPDLTASGRLWQGRWGQAALVKLLSTGLGPGGNPADPPMPTYKMTQDDAEAVVEYLKSLK